MNCYDTGIVLPTVNISDCNCTNEQHIYIPHCECPYPPAPPRSLIEDFTPALAYGAVFLIGTIGNLLVIFVVKYYKSMRSVTNVFLASLSTADLCLIWFCVPVQYLKYISYSWHWGLFMCYAVHYVQQFTMVCSVLTLTAISIERYLAIVYPMKSIWISSIGRAKKTVFIIWMLSFVLASPAAARISYITSEPDYENRTAHWCLQQFPVYNWATEDFVASLERVYCLYQFILFLLVPVATMAYCYIRIGLVVYASAGGPSHSGGPDGESGGLRRHSKNTETIRVSKSVRLAKGSQRNSQGQINVNSTTNKTADNNKKQIVHMLILIVSIYVCCWSPTIVDELLIGFGWICGTSITAGLRYMRLTFAALEYVQSCSNPVVYAFMSANFRRSFGAAFRRQANERQRRKQFINETQATFRLKTTKAPKTSTSSNCNKQNNNLTSQKPSLIALKQYEQKPMLLKDTDKTEDNVDEILKPESTTITPINVGEGTSSPVEPTFV